MFDDIQGYYSFVKTTADKLRENNFTEIADILNHRMYKLSWTTATELLCEIGKVLTKFKADSWDNLSKELQSDIDNCLNYIENVEK